MKTKIKPNEHEDDMLLKIGIWLSKFMNDTQADRFVYKLTDVHDDENKIIGTYELTVKKIK